jgi:hypothetical protein
VVVVVVVSAELAHPEIKTAVSASAAKAINLFFIAVNSQGEGKVDASFFCLSPLVLACHAVAMRRRVLMPFDTLRALSLPKRLVIVIDRPKGCASMRGAAARRHSGENA